MLKRATVAWVAAALVVAAPAIAREFSASAWLPDTHPLTKFGYLDWAKKVEAASGGALKPNVFTGTVMLPPAAHLSGLRDGVADMTYHGGTYTAKELPIDNLIAQTMFSYADYFTTAFAYTDFAMTDPDSRAQFKGNGIVFGGASSTPQYVLFCREKVTSLADVKGKKLRLAISGAHAAWAKSVDAVQVSVVSSEMYSGLDKGQLDCASNGANEMKSRSLWDVAKHVTLVELGVYWAGWQYGFNRGFWGSLSDGERRILLDTIADQTVDTGLGYLASADEAIAEAKDHGVTIHRPEADLVKSIEDHRTVVRQWAIDYGKETLGLDDPEAILVRFEARYAKWEKLLDGVDRSDAAALKAVLKENLYDKVDVSAYGLD